MLEIEIISGGQTGADRGGLDAAIRLGLNHGGYCPRGRRAEDGGVPVKYGLLEHTSSSYPDRTRSNVLEADATLLVGRGDPTSGTLLTIKLCLKYDKPWKYIDLDKWAFSNAIEVVYGWLKDVRPRMLNIAGPRESRCPGIQVDTEVLLCCALTRH